MNKNQKNKQRRTLKLTRETIVHLTDDLLRKVVGGSIEVTKSIPFSECPAPCAPGRVK